MIYASRPPIAAIVCFAGASFAAAPAFSQAPAVADPLDVQALRRGEEAINAQKYQDAVKEFEGLIAKYPQSATIPQALFRLGYAFYLLGEYDKAAESFQKASIAKGAPPEIVELALSLTPQVIAAKASKLKADDPARDAALNDAIKQFDVFLGKFPNSEEAESANMGKALALFQLKKFDEAAQALRTNLQKFAQSESIQDSQYTLALILGADGASALAKATAPDPAAMAKLEEGERLLRDIIARRVNLALVNDAQFQLGEMLNARAVFTDAKKKDERDGFFKKALEAYRGVFTKDQVIAAQKQRIEAISQRRIEAGKKGDVAGLKRLQRLQEKEQEKLAPSRGAATRP
jgi:TolA-binding protein